MSEQPRSYLSFSSPLSRRPAERRGNPIDFENMSSKSAKEPFYRKCKFILSQTEGLANILGGGLNEVYQIWETWNPKYVNENTPVYILGL